MYESSDIRFRKKYAVKNEGLKLKIIYLLGTW